MRDSRAGISSLSSDHLELSQLGYSFLLSHPWISSRLVPAHPALVNAIILVLHSVAGSTPMPGADASSRSMPSGSYRDMPGEPRGAGVGPSGAGSAQVCCAQQLCIALAEGIPWELLV